MLTADELSGCTTAQEVDNIPTLTEGKPGFEGSEIYIPGPIFRNAIMTSNTTNPFELIPLINTTARTFIENLTDDDLASMNGNPVNHADDINTWFYGIHL